MKRSMTVERDITLLCQNEAGHSLQREFAVVRFCAWLNWPAEPFASTNLSLTFLLHAIRAQQAGKIVFDAHAALAEIDANSILSHADLETLIHLPFFQDIDPGHGWFNNIDYIADIVRFLLSFNMSKTRDSQLKASLGKATYFINQLGGFPGDEKIKKRSHGWADSHHQVVWKRYKHTAAFQFVRAYDSRLNWIIDPSNPHFLEAVIDIAKREEYIVEYFSKCLWVQNKLKLVVDRRAMPTKDYVVFAQNVVAQPCNIPTFPRWKLAKMADYSRNRSGMYFD